MKDKLCPQCGKKIEGKHSTNKKYCTRKCANQFAIDNFRRNNPATSLPKGTVGTISELKICIDLLGKGYEVFRAVSTTCSCDIAFLHKEKLFRVEVTTGYIGCNNNIIHAKPANEKHRYDYLAIVTKCGKIIYQPELEVL